jgi:hypothetical protein
VNVPLLMGFALPFAGGTPHVGPPVKLSASVPCELPLAFGDHLTTSETGVVVGSLEMLVSAEQVTSSVVVRCAT